MRKVKLLKCKIYSNLKLKRDSGRCMFSTFSHEGISSMLQKKEDGTTRKQDEAIQLSKSEQNKGLEKSSEIQFEMTMTKELISEKF